MAVPFIAGAAVGWYAWELWKNYKNPPPQPASPPRTIPGYKATAESFSNINEKDVQKHLDLGKRRTALEIKDVFYGGLITSHIDDEEEQPLYYIPDSAYDPRYDRDFTDYKGDDNICVRGDYPYTRPAGWNRKAINVIKKYEDDVWLGQGGWRNTSSPVEWPVSYHGTEIQNVPSMVEGDYDTNKFLRGAYGPGIFSTPDIEVADGYATEFTFKGENCKCILQNRVNLNKTKQQKTDYGMYFVTPDMNDIRPYGVYFQKI